MRLSAIIPATDRPSTVEACLRAIEHAREPPEEVLLIADEPVPGPAHARNRGAQQAAGDILVFIDADIEVHDDAFELIRQAFARDPDLVGVFGSYDDDPERHGVISDFRNLLHHHVHQSSPGPASTFWAGLGAIRRAAFVGAGGFDERRFSNPSVEDIELGMRLTSKGMRLLLDPAIQGKHLKRWTLANMVRTDSLRRGAPWVRLLLERGSSSTALNLGWRQRASVVVSLLLVTAVALRRPGVAATSAVTLVVINRSFYRLLARQRGWRLAVAGPPLHLIHHLVSAAAVPLGVASYLHARRRG
jgi:GT2 family glycosyltransferase